MKSPSSFANICCSFEQEPQTLSAGQLTQAREVAKNQEPTEASTSLSFNQQNNTVNYDKNGEQVQKMELHGSRQHKDHKTCRCFCAT
ncbi:hypothetical protein K1719_019624 [Acacia pycnantha]|nr:hypothetical protein K1719_019624 [Acacia pycnantha]